MTWIYLIAAVLAEILGTFFLKYSNGFHKTIPSIGVVLTYGLATYLLSIVAKSMPIGAVYAMWSAFGITGSLLIDHYVFLEKYSTYQLSGFILIVAGSVIINISRV